jgi:putative membrane protein
MLMRLVVRWAANAIALYVAAWLLSGVTYGDEWWTLLVAAAVFTVVNAWLRPIVRLLSLPLIILTLGIAYFFVNLAMLLLTSALVDGFSVDGFWTAVAATILIWLVNAVLGMVTRPTARDER